MVKTVKSARYICSACGENSSMWSGRCLKCGEWNTLEIQTSLDGLLSSNKIVSLSLDDSFRHEEKRMTTGIVGVDEVFGGGIVSGSVILISGEPGMGKSTLMLQIADSISRKSDVIYISGEESTHQLSMRAKRLSIDSQRLKISSSNSTNDIVAEIMTSKAKLVIVDSIQSITCNEVGSSAGSITQVSNSSLLIAQAAKRSNTSVIIIGQVTKEGSFAGPKLLEHIVDVVLSLEGEINGGFKLLRVSKNRFGSTNETAIFQMEGEGLIPMTNPSAVLLEQRKITDGSVVLATMEGSRPILVEVQALVNKTSYGYPKRAVSGLELGRLNLLVAMLERRCKLSLSDKDIYVNVVGGLKISEPAADLAVVMAIGSATKSSKLKDNSVVFGEVGLSGEVRHVPYIDKRLNEAKALGFSYGIGPKLPNSKSNPFLKSVPDVLTALNNYLI